MNADNQPQRYAPWLWLLLALFCLRVLGQMLVAFFHVSFLPPMKEWYSGLIPYHWLLPSQFELIDIECTTFDIRCSSEKARAMDRRLL